MMRILSQSAGASLCAATLIRCLALLGAIGGLTTLVAGSVLAQTPPTSGGTAEAVTTGSGGEAPILAALEIGLWPEYDRPEVLVIYSGVVAEDTALPATLEIRIPARAGQPTAVAYVDDAGQLLNQAYTTGIEGDQLVVSFDLLTRAFQLEYYETLPGEDGSRVFTFDFQSDYAIAALSLEVQQPPTAQGFVLEPEGGTASTAADGLTYWQVDAGPVSPGEQRSWTFRYDKADASLTRPPSSGTGSVPESTTGSGAEGTARGGNSTVLIFAIAFVALVAVGAGAFWLGRRVEPAPEPPPRAKRRGSGKGLLTADSSAAGPAFPSLSRETLFCFQCGTPLRSDALFCHRCGAAVRE